MDRNCPARTILVGGEEKKNAPDESGAFELYGLLLLACFY